MLALLLLSGISIMLLPIHVYTPLCVEYCASTMWRVDVTLPGVMEELSAAVVGCVIISDCLNAVFWLLIVHMIEGIGPPIEMQQIVTLSPL